LLGKLIFGVSQLLVCLDNDTLPNLARSSLCCFNAFSD
jgi:hypothetical protein